MKKVLVVSSERMSGLVDWTDQGNLLHFRRRLWRGGAGRGDSYLASELHTKGGEDVIAIPTWWNNSPFYQKELRKNCVFMQGQETYKFAVTAMPADIKAVLEKAGPGRRRFHCHSPPGQLPHHQ